MEGIYNANDTFKFEKLLLTKPTIISGGNYFIKLLVNDNPLYIQPPKCKLKQGISKAGKRMFADLMFTNENDQFIRWMENLENHCQKNIFNNREQWFDGELEMADIENYFTPPLKVYKSGKFYIIRTNITTMLGKSVFKIYDENEKEVDMDNINENMNIMTILEIQGIKCSARSFQIEIELKQMLVMNPINIFDKCLLRTKHPDIQQVLKQDNNEDLHHLCPVKFPCQTVIHHHIHTKYLRQICHWQNLAISAQLLEAKLRTHRVAFWNARRSLQNQIFTNLKLLQDLV
jgi:hypothetical protein